MRRRARVNDNSPARSEHLRLSRLILILAEIDVGKRLSVRGVRRGMVYRFRMEDDRTSVSMMRTTSLTIGSPASSVHSSTSILTVDGDFWARRLSAITCRSDAVNLRLPAIIAPALRRSYLDERPSRIFENIMHGTVVTVTFTTQTGKEDHNLVHFGPDEMRVYRWHSDVLAAVSGSRERIWFFRFIELLVLAA